MSASVQWVAIRMIETPELGDGVDVLRGPDPGQQQGRDPAPARAVATAVAISSRSGVLEKP